MGQVELQVGPLAEPQVGLQVGPLVGLQIKAGHEGQYLITVVPTCNRYKNRGDVTALTLDFCYCVSMISMSVVTLSI